MVADSWLRVSKTNAVELGMQSAPAEYITKVSQSEDPGKYWQIWLNQIVRRAVVGGPLDSDGVVACSDQIDLLSIVTEIENRQRRWHEPGQHPFGKNGHPMAPTPPTHENEDDGKEKDHLCIRIVGSARAVIAKFNFDPSDYPEGVEPITPADAH